MAEDISNTCQPPEWLNEAFLQMALKNSFRRGSLEFIDYNICLATKKGENYVSQMFRVSATVGSRLKEPETTSVVVKSMPRGENAVQFIHEMKFFETEAKMFSETLPILQMLLDEAGGIPKLFADIYYHQGPPNDLLIMEDLKRSGFFMVNRLSSLDLNHCILVVESLATLHAASLEAVRKNPEFCESYDDGFWTVKKSHRSRKWIEEGIEALAEVVETWDEFPADLPRKLRDQKSEMPDKVYKATEFNVNGMNVLNHGDPWTNNFMFKLENGDPIDMKFVDFQLCAYNHPVTDLHYLIFTSPKKEVISNNLGILLERYHCRLVDVCNKLHYPLEYSLEELKSDFFKKLAFGFAISLTIFPFVVNPSTDGPELDDIIGDDGIGINKDFFYSEGFTQIMKAMLPIFLEHRLFD